MRLTDALPTIEVVYMGRRLLKGGKLGDMFITAAQLAALTEAGVSAETVEYAASIFGSGGKRTATVIGGLYTAEAEIADGRIQVIKLGRLKYDRKVGTPFEGAWVGNDKAAQAHKQQEAELAKAAKNDALTRDIERLISHYNGVAPGNRMAFKLMVLAALDKGKV